MSKCDFFDLFYFVIYSAAVIALIVSSSNNEHLMTLHIGTACMAFISGIMYIFTLYGADSSEFTATRDEEIRRERERKIFESGEPIDPNITGVRVIGDDDEYNITQYNINNNNENKINDEELNDQTPLINKHVTIQA